MGWQRLTYAGLKRVYRPEQIIVLIMPSGLCYTGHVSELTQTRIELNNGDHHTTVYYSEQHIRYSLIDPPEKIRFARGESQLSLDGEAKPSPA